MKTLKSKQILMIISTLVAGIFLGWVFFGNNSNTKSKVHNHNESQDKAETYTCSMHPQIRSNEPGQCPLCGMDLIPVQSSSSSMDNSMAVEMSETAMKLADVRTMEVGKSVNEKVIDLTGKVQVDERLVKTQASHIAGRVEKLYVNFIGEQVQQGQKLAEIYSPDLVTAQEELFEAIKFKTDNPSLYQAARNKLLTWKLSVQEINELEKTLKAKEVFPIIADVSGYVLEQQVQRGDYIRKGQSLFQVADLSSVWLMLDVYEQDFSWVKLGSEVQFTSSSIPGKSFKGSITYIDPVIDPKTRVAQARVEVQNLSGELKPEQFVNGRITSKLKSNNASGISVPRSAVLWTGKRSVVYVQIADAGEGHFQMREVTLGASLGEHYLIKEGLEKGEVIAVSGAFNIDAAAQLEGKPSMMNRSGGPAMTGHNHGGEKTSSLILKS
ncbi:MAG: efflux RND transporter periplasmic adaptor subunit [Flavobacteriales bacterium]|nr:efflux RND transporter periplasmic adaptor subunit [Flavobacteriales bacterium]